ncbi:MAG: zinc ribbon domain-containing protein [Clostridiales bacterium]|jgi:hypothetical protein|nr:zinc ribbon domain-containing protein [Clostridiales bacterium]HPO53701.1 zinc ribbon domain-containing protein [Clostridia bacterium]
MKYCTNCGTLINDEDLYCRHCGYKVSGEKAARDTGNPLWGLLGFFFPIVGLILFLVWRDDRPKDSKSAGIGALVSLIMGIVVVIFVEVITWVTIGAVLAGELQSVGILPLL